MRLTDEQIKVFKEGKKHPGLYIYDLFDTIEALQQEYDELDAGHSKLYKAYCEMKQEAEQLQAQAAQYREAVEVLETVTEHLENCYGRDTPDTEKAREVLAAIDKIGGQENV